MEFFNDLIKEKYFYENAFPVENVCMPSWNVDEYMENEIDRLKKELRNTDIVSRKALIEEITGDLLKEIIGLYQCGINNRNTFPDNGAAAKQWEKYQYPNNLYLHEALGHVINIASDYEIEYSEEFINKWRTLRTRFSDVDMCLPDKYKESPADSNNRHAVLENEQERKPAQTADENLRKMRNDQFVNGYNNLVNYINEMDPIPINEKHQYLDNLMIAISEQLNRFSTCKTDYLKYIKTRLNNKEQFNIWASGSPILDNSKIPNVFDRIDGLIYEIENLSKIDQNRNSESKMAVNEFVKCKKNIEIDKTVSQQEQSQKTGIGTNFTDRIVSHDVDVVEILRQPMAGKKGRNAALIIQAAIKKGLITKPTYTEIVNEFGNIGNKSGYNKYMRYKFTDEELAPIMNRL
jgi:hypothetical protein